MNTKEATNINIVMGDLEYLIRDGLKDWRSSTPKGLIAVKKILRNVYALLQQGEADSKELKITKEELKKVWQMWEELYGIASEFNFFPLMDKLEQKYFPKSIKREEVIK